MVQEVQADRLNSNAAERIAKVTDVGSTPFEQISPAQTGLVAGFRPRPHLLIALLIALAACAVYLPLLGSYRIIEPSDGFYTEAGREMLESCDFIVPHLSYQIYFDKPILIYWLIVAAFKVFGVTTFAARLPSALAAVAMSVVTFVFARTFLTTRTAVSAAVILCSSALLLIIGHVDLIDAPLSLMVELSALSFFLALEADRRSLLWLAYVSLGIGILLKGPVILVLVGGSVVFYLLATRKIADARAALKMLKLAPGLAITFAIAVPWYALVGLQTHGEFLTEFFFKHNILRALGQIKLSHEQPFYYYVPVLFVGTAPWSWLLLANIPFIRSLSMRRYEASLPDKAALFCVAWSAAVFLFFSALVSKLGTYMLPLLPAVSILSAMTLDRLVHASSKRALNIGVWSNCVLLTVGFVCAWRYFQPDSLVGLGLIVALVAYTSAAIGCSVLSALGWQQKSLAVLLSLNMIGSALLGPTLMWGFYNRRQLDYGQIIEAAGRYQGDLSEAIAPRASLGFYLHKKVPCIEDIGALVQFMHQSNQPHMIVVYYKFLNFVQNVPVHEELAHYGQWYLYRIEDPENRLLNQYHDALKHLNISRSAFEAIDK